MITGGCRLTFQPSTIRIGVSNKCCFCCRLLGEVLNNTRKITDDNKYPEFILPWLPPSGVPPDALKSGWNC